MSESNGTGERVLKGIPASGGVCHGSALILDRLEEEYAQRRIKDEEIPREIERFQEALIRTRKDIQGVQHRVNEAMGSEHASIFEAHLLVLEDHTLIDEVLKGIQEDKCNVEAAFKTAASKYVRALEAIDDNFIRERAADMRDATDRILRHLLGKPSFGETLELTEPRVLISHDLAPSTTALLDKTKVLGFATDVGSKTAHTAILARSLNIPAVVGLQDISSRLKTGEEVLVDGFDGTVIINPSDQTLFEYGKLAEKHADFEARLTKLKDLPAETLDGKKIVLAANIEKATGAEEARECGAEGVGLFRTEYLFIYRKELPDEEEQYHSYRQVATDLHPRPVVIRTLDLGGDKLLSHLELPIEMNPFLGWRAIRFCLQQKDIFKSQLRAILRASSEGNIQIMYPMITSAEELCQANQILEECKEELRRNGQPFDENVPIGAMIETPAAAVAADTLAERVSFFSIGTNDLIQYALAVDRLNERIAHLYEPSNPAIIRLIKMTVDAAHRAGIRISVCGEVGGDPIFVPLLLGLGVDELSTAPSVLPSVKYLIRHLNMADARELAEFATESKSGREILDRCEALIRKSAPALIDTNLT